MRLGIHFVNFDVAGGPAAIPKAIRDTARAADDAGIATLSLMDHWFQMDTFAAATDPMLEGYTTLGFIAGMTERIQLSLLVTGGTWPRSSPLSMSCQKVEPSWASVRPGTSGSIWGSGSPSRP